MLYIEELTPWFPPEVKPVNEGWYEIEDDGSYKGMGTHTPTYRKKTPFTVYRYWTNDRGWMWTPTPMANADSVLVNHRVPVFYTTKVRTAWRGLAETFPYKMMVYP